MTTRLLEQEPAGRRSNQALRSPFSFTNEQRNRLNMPYNRFALIRAVVVMSAACCAIWIPAIQAAISPSPQRMTDAQILGDLKENLDRLTRADQFSGAVLVAKNDRILFEHAYGYANHAFNVPNKVDTKFNLGSMNKMFTAVSILQLVQQGRFSLNDTLIKVLPDYPDQDIAGKVTLHQLLTHTSGMGNFFGELVTSNPGKYRAMADYLPLITGKPLLFEPGARWSYSNSGFAVLGLVIERVSGQNYFDYVREHIIKPAGMINTDSYSMDDDVPNLALGYTNLGEDGFSHPERPRKSNIYMTLARGMSAGGGYSTVEDLLRFARALQGHKLLNEEYTDLMMRGKVPAGAGQYSYGIGEEFQNGVRIVGHNGGGPGIHSNLDMYPDLGYTVAIMSNYDAPAYQLVNGRLQMELTGQRIPRALHLPPGTLQSYVGKYAMAAPPGVTSEAGPPPMQITADEQGLVLALGPSGTHKLLPVSDTEFFDEGNPHVRHRFAKDDKGRMTMTVTGLGPKPITAIMLPWRP
jgi:CubicO group peptidase (beta-lactamase class C family)